MAPCISHAPFESSLVETASADMAFWAYIQRCADGSYYTSHADDLARRVAQHSAGGFCAYTSRRLPLTLIWSQEFPSRYEPLSAELRVKKWSRAQKEALAASDWRRLSYFARPPGERVSTSLDTNGRTWLDAKGGTSLDANEGGAVDGPRVSA